MTIFAGIVARGNDTRVSTSMVNALRSRVSRFPGETFQEFTDDHSYLVKVDLGVFRSPGVVVDAAGSVSMLAGEPLLLSNDGDSALSREADLMTLHGSWKARDWNRLAGCTGTFCAAHYDPADRTVCLISDKIGVRPIYYWIGPRFTVFATALRILEEFDEVPKELDLQGVTEVACFGYPLDVRTPYKNIRMLREAEVVSISATDAEYRQYWQWNRLPVSGRSIQESARIAHEKFVGAIRRRLKADRTVASFLSGGLDSRAIVATLRALDVAVHTTNFAEPGTQDYVFGEQIGRALGTMHQQTPDHAGRAGDPYRKAGVAKWLESESVGRHAPDRPGLIWSGDGGSVGVGHVYLTQAMIDRIKADNLHEAADKFLAHNNWGIPKMLFHSSIAMEIGSFPRDGIKAELERLRCDDFGRAQYLFLMFNDQRRHLGEHFENIDLDRIEFQMPFFDSEFLQSVVTVPVEQCLGHKFYMEWLKCFAPTVTAVPWQAYPGHVPCPIPAQTGLAYQWGKGSSADARAQMHAMASRYAGEIWRARAFPAELISRVRLWAAALVTILGLRDYNYVLKAAAIYIRYWGLCERKRAASHLPLR